MPDKIQRKIKQRRDRVEGEPGYGEPEDAPFGGAGSAADSSSGGLEEPFAAPEPTSNLAAVSAAAGLLASGERCLLLIGTSALLAAGLEASARIGSHCMNSAVALNSKLNAARIRRGAEVRTYSIRPS